MKFTRISYCIGTFLLWGMSLRLFAQEDHIKRQTAGTIRFAINEAELQKKNLTIKCNDCYSDYGVPLLQYKFHYIPVAGNKKLEVISSRNVYREIAVDLRKEIGEFDKKIFEKNDWYPASPVLVGTPGWYRGQKLVPVFFYPVQIHKSLRKVRVYPNLQYSLKEIPDNFKTQKIQRNYVANSVLSQGQLLKIKIDKTGVYKITGKDLKQAGIDVSTFTIEDIRKIQLFGNGGGYVPQPNDAYYPDDLLENPIKIVGVEDSVFDDNDYILFFGESSEQWHLTSQKLIYEENPYEKYSYYFLRFGVAQGKRIPLTNGETIYSKIETSVKQEKIIEENDENWLHSGRTWWSKPMQFTLEKNYDFKPIDVDYSMPVYVESRVAARGYVSSQMEFYLDNKKIGDASFSPQNDGISRPYAAIVKVEFTENVSAANNLKLHLKYIPSGNSIAWVDYVRLDYYRKLSLNPLDQFFIRYFPQNQKVKLLFSGNLSDYECWDVTRIYDIKEQKWYFSDGFAFNSDTLNRFIVFKENQLYSPLEITPINNQNLHALDFAEYFIITAKSLRSEAERLANFHKDYYGHKVTVVNAEEIFNEFGSGKRDMGAIRNFLRMFYEKASTDAKKPKYVLLFVDGSYDNRGNKFPLAPLPSYQSRDVDTETDSHCSDDFITFLDSTEGAWREASYMTYDDIVRDVHLSDVAVGRIPATSISEAKNVVDKIIRYVSDRNLRGEWMNRVIITGDYKASDGTIHIAQAENLTNIILQRNPVADIKKIYIEAYPSYKTSRGILFPDANKTIAEELDKGALIFNYTGHGGPYQLSYSNIINTTTIGQIKNEGRTTFWTTATCTFGVWDRPDLHSGGELLLLMPGSGAIGLMTAVRTVFSSYNAALNNNFYRRIYLKDATTRTYKYIGDIYRDAKNASYQPGPGDENGGVLNARSFSLLCDPAIKLAYPELPIRITKINNVPITNDSMIVDTLKALSFVTFEGEVLNADSSLASDFNGEAFVTIYDKREFLRTLLTGFTFWEYNIKLFKGLVSVKQGKFKVSCYIPLDINYNKGEGKITVYARSEDRRTAAGINDQFVICCLDTMAQQNNTPPTVNLYIDNEKWIDGSTTTQNPLLFIKVEDDQGINTTGLGVGRELKAILDGDEANPIILNDYFETEKDEYKKGTIKYRLKNLEEGHHTISVKIWDISNNSATAETEFWVANEEELKIRNVVNYPNPFTTNTTFLFEHNRIGYPMKVVIKIFTVSGKLVKSIESNFLADKSLIDHITWNGRDDKGDRLARGVYLYQVNISIPSTGETFSKYEKLVLLR